MGLKKKFLLVVPERFQYCGYVVVERYIEWAEALVQDHDVSCVDVYVV